MTDDPISHEEYVERLHAAFAEIASLVHRRWEGIVGCRANAQAAVVARRMFQQRHGDHADPNEIIWSRAGPEVVSPCKLPVLIQRAELAPAWAAYCSDAQEAIAAVEGTERK